MRLQIGFKVTAFWPYRTHTRHMCEFYAAVDFAQGDTTDDMVRRLSASAGGRHDNHSAYSVEWDNGRRCIFHVSDWKVYVCPWREGGEEIEGKE